MAKLIERFEKTIKLPNGTIQHQVLELEVDADTEEFSYEDVKINLYINNNFIADISHVIATTDTYTSLIDSVNWSEKLRAARLKTA